MIGVESNIFLLLFHQKWRWQRYQTNRIYQNSNSQTTPSFRDYCGNLLFLFRSFFKSFNNSYNASSFWIAFLIRTVFSLKLSWPSGPASARVLLLLLPLPDLSFGYSFVMNDGIDCRKSCREVSSWKCRLVLAYLSMKMPFFFFSRSAWSYR